MWTSTHYFIFGALVATFIICLGILVAWYIEEHKANKQADELSMHVASMLALIQELERADDRTLQGWDRVGPLDPIVSSDDW